MSVRHSRRLINLKGAIGIIVSPLGVAALLCCSTETNWLPAGPGRLLLLRVPPVVSVTAYTVNCGATRSLHNDFCHFSSAILTFFLEENSV